MIKIDVLASGSKGNCYRISDGETSLLLDAGINFRDIEKGCKYRVHDISGCLISHIHGDHSKGIPELVRRGVKVMGPLEVHEKYPEVNFVVDMKFFNVGSWRVAPFKVVHDAECFGYKVHSNSTGENLVYVTDAGYIPYGFDDIDYWLVEANHSEALLRRRRRKGYVSERLAYRIAATHMSINTLYKYFSRIERLPEEIYLLHLSDGNSNERWFKTLIEREMGVKVTVA